MKPKVFVIAGPTGSGKSSLGLEVAAACGAEIVGCDSVQLFQKFDIGSAKPSLRDRAAIPHHMIDTLLPTAEYDAAKFAAAAVAVCEDIVKRGKRPLLVGGSGLYLRTLIGAGWHADLPSDPQVKARLQEQVTSDLYQQLQKRDATRASELHPNDRFRIVRALELLELLGKPLRDLPPAEPPLAAKVILLIPDRAELHERISQRTQTMLACGFIEEVRALLAQGVARDARPMQSIGYKEVADFLCGDLARHKLEDAINASTRQYAKRQCTWFRKVQADLVLKKPDPTAVMHLMDAHSSPTSGWSHR